jgi:hypothetical protein
VIRGGGGPTPRSASCCRALVSGLAALALWGAPASAEPPRYSFDPSAAVFSHPEPLLPPGAAGLALEGSALEIDLYPSAWSIRARLELVGPDNPASPWTLGLAGRGAQLSPLLWGAGAPGAPRPERARLYAPPGSRLPDVELPASPSRAPNFLVDPSPWLRALADGEPVEPHLRRYLWYDPAREDLLRGQRPVALAPFLWWAFELQPPAEGRAVFELDWLQPFTQRTLTDAAPAPRGGPLTCTGEAPEGTRWHRLEARLVLEHEAGFLPDPAPVSVLLRTHAPSGSVTCVHAEARGLEDGSLALESAAAAGFFPFVSIELWLPAGEGPLDEAAWGTPTGPLHHPDVRLAIDIEEDDARMEVSPGGGSLDRLRLGWWVPEASASGLTPPADYSVAALPRVWQLHDRIARFAREWSSRQTDPLAQWLALVDELRAVALSDPDPSCRAFASALLWELFGGCEPASPAYEGCAQDPGWPLTDLPAARPVESPGLIPMDPERQSYGALRDLYFGDLAIDGEREYAGAAPFASGVGAGIPAWELETLNELRLTRARWLYTATRAGAALAALLAMATLTKAARRLR